MQITLAQAGDDITVILSQFECNFSFATAEMSECVESISQSLIQLSISKLKGMTDFLSQAFTVPLAAPKRNSKISLGKWLSQVLLSATQLEHDKFSEVSVTPEVEVLEPEPKPVYKVRLVADNLTLSEYRLSDIPPYLVHSGRLFSKTATYDFLDSTHYDEAPSEHLSNLETLDGGTLIQLLTESLVVIETVICGVPPLYLITKQGGVYKRMQRGLITLHSPIKYAQVICEDLSNLEVI